MRHTDVWYVTVKQNVKQMFGFGILPVIFFYDAIRVVALWAWDLRRR